MTSLHGLHNIKTVGGSLSISSLPVADLDELSNLTSVGGLVSSASNYYLQIIDGLSGVTHASGVGIQIILERHCACDSRRVIAGSGSWPASWEEAALFPLVHDNLEGFLAQCKRTYRAGIPRRYRADWRLSIAANPCDCTALRSSL